jgi:hypothetical protein
MGATLVKQLKMLQRNVRFWGVRLYDGREQAPWLLCLNRPLAPLLLI